MQFGFDDAEKLAAKRSSGIEESGIGPDQANVENRNRTAGRIDTNSRHEYDVRSVYFFQLNSGGTLMSFENSQVTQFRSVFGKVLASAVVGLALTSMPLSSWSQDDAGTVKMSKGKICHDSSSPHYARLKNFKSYASIQACLDDGGRLPKK